MCVADTSGDGGSERAGSELVGRERGRGGWEWQMSTEAVRLIDIAASVALLLPAAP